MACKKTGVTVSKMGTSLLDGTFFTRLSRVTVDFGRLTLPIIMRFKHFLKFNGLLGSNENDKSFIRGGLRGVVFWGAVYGLLNGL